MEKIEKFLAEYSLLIILVLSIPAVLALIPKGFYGASDDIHIAWLYEMDAAIRATQIPPRFVPDLSFGFGYPLFNFAFPLPFYIGEIFHALGFSLVDSIKAVFILSIPVSMYLMYKFLREFSSEILSLAGAAIYTFTPYRSTDIYVRGAIGEIFAFVFPPLISWAIVKLTDGKKIKIRWIGILGLGIAGLVLSHNIMAYMFVPFLILLFVVRIFYLPTPRFPVFLKGLVGFGFGLLASLYFWLPAIVESTFMKYDTVFNYWDQFPALKQLFTPYFGYGGSNPGQNLVGMSFFVGLINLVLVFGAVFTLIFFWKKIDLPHRVIIFWALATFFIGLFMMNYRSIFIWRVIPLLPYFQFPWRFLSLTTFVTPIMIIAFSKLKFANYIGIVLLVLAVAFNYKDFKPQDFLGRTDAYYINRYIPTPIASKEYYATNEEYLRLPKDTSERPDKNYPRVASNVGRITKVNYLTSLDAEFQTESSSEVLVNYNKYLFPGWFAKVDGKRVALIPGQPFGQITFLVPAGKHEVKVGFGETSFRMATDLISLLSIVAAATIALKPGLVKYEK